MDENIPSNAQDKIIPELGDFGYAQTEQDVLNETKQNADAYFDKDIVMVFTIVGLTFVCIFSMTFINMKRYLKKAHIYLLTGSTRRNVFLIYCTYMSMIIITSGILYWSIANIINEVTKGPATVNDIRLTAFSPGLYTIVFALTFITLFMGVVSLLTFKFMTNGTATENRNRRNF